MRNAVQTIVWAMAVAMASEGAFAVPEIWRSTEAEDYTVDRKEVFEFAGRPVVRSQKSEDGNRIWETAFTSKDFCDATVAIEKKDGTILRHLAAGVLGPNAPEPFRKKSLDQKLVWDGKDDLERYIDNLAGVRVRVSLGLKPRFEKMLDRFPKRRVAWRRAPMMVAQPEGVYVYDGGGIESIRLYGHDGRYIRTVYPFPANKVKDVKGLNRYEFADGWRAPKCLGFYAATCLKGGIGRKDASWGTSATAFAVNAGRIASRFTLKDMREVPFDYGENRAARHPGTHGGPMLMSAIVLPGNLPGNWKESGMGVNAKGEIVAHCHNAKWRYTPSRYKWNRLDPRLAAAPKAYRLPIYPGRLRHAEIHVFDKHGKVIGMDIVGRGAPGGNNTYIDARGDVYFFSAQNRRYPNPAFSKFTGCVMKFKRGKGRFLTPRGALSLPKEAYPGVPPHFGLGNNGDLWVQDVEWVYPGAGFARNSAPCTCWRSQFALDLLGRSFIPSGIRNQVAVLDTNGNLILHMGRTGNVDDGVPLVEDMRYRTEKPRPIGGDELALFYANHLAVHSDQRLYITDTGNSRIVSVKLDYHAVVTVPVP